jgi:hypothetical protein
LGVASGSRRVFPVEGEIPYKSVNIAAMKVHVKKKHLLFKGFERRQIIFVAEISSFIIFSYFRYVSQLEFA